MSSTQSSNSSASSSNDGGKSAGFNSSMGVNLNIAGQEKQKMLLAADTGHFSMIRLVESQFSQRSLN